MSQQWVAASGKPNNLIKQSWTNDKRTEMFNSLSFCLLFYIAKTSHPEITTKF
jgi:hypothetical protein